MERLAEIGQKTLHAALSILFPKDGFIESLERMDNEALIKALRALPPAPGKERGRPETLSLFSYKDPRVKKIITEIKYRENKRLARALGHLMAEKIVESFEDGASMMYSAQKIVLVPVPTSPAREKSANRGYNPARLIAESIALARPDLFTLADILIKTRETARQASLPRAKRLTNLAGAFAIKETKKEKLPTITHAIIVDDICTTGATLAETNHALIDAFLVQTSLVTIAN